MGLLSGSVSHTPFIRRIEMSQRVGVYRGRENRWAGFSGLRTPWVTGFRGSTHFLQVSIPPKPCLLWVPVLSSMGRAGGIWTNFRYRCQNVFSREGGSRGENVDVNSSRCLPKLTSVSETPRRKCCFPTGINPFREFLKDKPKLGH